MEPDTYQIKNTARPMTALRAWLDLNNLSSAWIAGETDLSLNTIYSAVDGKSISRSSARLISGATKLSTDVLIEREKKTGWTLTKRDDGTWEAQP